jgi:ribosomal protein S18 acetylase RimI-like enzyme
VPRDLALRPEEPKDTAFLRSLFATSRSGTFEAAQLNEEALTALLDMQFEAQRRHYAGYYPEARSWLLVEDGEPVGRLIEAAEPDHLLLIDLAVAPSARRRGLATWMIGTVAQKARADGVPVMCHVDPNNDAALRLYTGLGFTVTGDEAGSLVLELGDTT